MRSSFISSITGYVKVEIRGKRIERLLNLAVQNRYSLWDVSSVGREKSEGFVALRDFFRLRPLLKQTGCRIHVLERYGLPFFLDKLGKRKFFAVGMLLFVIGIYLLSSVVWNVRVEGTVKLKPEQVLQAARQAGIYPMQWKFRLQDPDTLSRNLHTLLPGTAWVGVEIHGTQIRIRVVESKAPEQSPLMSPRNLIAAKNALVTEIFAEKGRPMVKRNTYVRKGDLLISGTIGEGEGQQTVVSQGTVRGIVWYTSKIESPLTRTYKVYTGDQKGRSYLVIGSRALQITGYGKPPFDQYETITDQSVLQWRQFKLPLGLMREKLMGMRMEEEPVDPAEAKALGLQQARTDLLREAGPDARIVSEKILHEKTENGKVYIEVHFEVEQNIAEEQPIIPGQGE